jgi:hypothetical protein
MIRKRRQKGPLHIISRFRFLAQSRITEWLFIKFDTGEFYYILEMLQYLELPFAKLGSVVQLKL